MSNLITKVPTTTSYRICKTTNEEHLNGVITLIQCGEINDIEPLDGIALIYVSETRQGQVDPVWHVSSELIVAIGNDRWKTKEPHIRINEHGIEVKQHWIFSKINNRSDGPGGGSNNLDNRVNYNSYIEYLFQEECEEPNICIREGDGTGTAGNGETGE